MVFCYIDSMLYVPIRFTRGNVAKEKTDGFFIRFFAIQCLRRQKSFLRVFCISCAVLLHGWRMLSPA